MDGRLIEASYENIREYITKQDSYTTSVSSKLSHSFKLISTSTFFLGFFTETSTKTKLLRLHATNYQFITYLQGK